MNRKTNDLASYKLPESLYDLAFDQYSRQFLAKRLIEANRAKKRLKILDVGGYKGRTRDFFPSDSVTILDLFDVTEPDYVMGSALDMPFDDASYDAVMCFDVYEHIAEKDRQVFIQEMYRVSSNLILIAAPFDKDIVAEAEVTLNNYYNKLNGHDHLWLMEHIDNGLPKIDQLEGYLKDLKLSYEVHHSNNIALWSFMQNLIFLADALNSPERIVKINEYYNRHLEELGDNIGISYRQIYLAKKGKLAPEVVDVESLDFKTLQRFISHVYDGVLELIYSNSTIRAQAEMLSEKDREIARLEDDLKSIYQSSSWKIALSLRRMKRLVSKRRP